NGWGNFSVAVSEGFDLLGRIIMTPEAGAFAKVQANDSPDYPINHYKQQSDLTSQAPAGGFVMPLLEGKFTETTWDFESCGYYWAEECQSRIGYFIDKTIAIETLADSQAYFTGRDTSVDVRKYAIGYYTIFKSQLQEKLGALLSGDYASLAPRLVKDSNG